MTVPDRAITTLGTRFLERFPDDAAVKLETLDSERLTDLLESQSDPLLISILQRISPSRAAEVCHRLSPPRAQQFLESADPAHAARVLATLGDEERESQLERLSPRLAAELRELISYPRQVAGSMMESRFLALRPETRVSDALSALRATVDRPREQVFVVDAEERLLGRVKLADLAVAPGEESLQRHLEPSVATIAAMAPREDVAALLGEHRLTSLPVLDAEGRLIGVIRQEGLIDATREELAADLQSMVGASREERALSRPGFAVRKRLPWLEVNLLTAFLAAAVVGLFEDTIARVTALAVLLPVVAGQSGNTGAQALAVTMRGLALREVRPRQWPRLLGKEISVGFINGLVVALTTAVAVYVWSRSEGLALVIGISMVVSMTIAGLAGGAIPLILAALRQDPAQSSSIVLTTVTDVAGFFSFLGIATLLASRL